MPTESRVPATEFITSADGTTIAYTRLGRGPAIVVVSGILNDRRKLCGLAEALSADFTVFHFDRRGRGESADSTSYSISLEVDDIAALVEAAGGSATVYGHSSGAALAAHAASAGLPIEFLVLHEPPYGPDDAESRASSKAFATSITELVHAGKHSEAIEAFMSAAGVPPEMIEGMVDDPQTVNMAPTMLYDIEIMGEISSGGSIPEAVIRNIEPPTLVLTGAASPQFFRDAAERLVSLLPFAESWRFWKVKTTAQNLR